MINVKFMYLIGGGATRDEKLAPHHAGMKFYILWDHDGVLVDTEPWYFEATRRCMRELGVELHEADYLGDMARRTRIWKPCDGSAPIASNRSVRCPGSATDPFRQHVVAPGSRLSPGAARR